MKLVALFDDFLRDTVNLNQNRLDRLEENVEALKNFIRQCDWTPHVRRFEDQGSWAHKTIIKPVDQGEFDADLLVVVDPVEDWSAADYLRKLGKAFSESATYGDKSKVWDYCVTVTYAGERKVDIAPCVLGREHADAMEVCNRSADRFDRTEPVQYTEWLKEKNSYSGSNSFRKVTRLLKYLRDIKGTFTCPSVLLTTLVGSQIEWFDKDSSDFADTPTTLRTIVGRLDAWLQERPTKSPVPNPKLMSEDFAEKWTEAQYSNFRSIVHKYRGWIDEAFETEGRPESIGAWRRVFGEDFAKGEDTRAAKSQENALAAYRNVLMTSTAAHPDSLVDAVANFGLRFLPREFYQIPYQQSPRWPASATVTNVSVSATWHASSDGPGRTVTQGELLPRRGGLWFDVRMNDYQAVPGGYSVHWRITNTGVMALALHEGRGGFYLPTQPPRRWERLQYRGVHIAEAFVVRMADDTLVGQSPPFHVVID